MMMTSNTKTHLTVTAKLLTNPSVTSVANAIVAGAPIRQHSKLSMIKRTLPTGTLLHFLFVVYVTNLATFRRTATKILRTLPLLPSGELKCNRRTFVTATATPKSTVTNPTPTITKLTTSSSIRTITKTVILT